MIPLKKLNRQRVLMHSDIQDILWRALIILSLIILALILIGGMLQSRDHPDVNEGTVTLPAPNARGGMALEGVILKRRSVRSYSDDSVSLEHLSQLLWAAQGITSEDGRRTAPSAGALYPLELYVVSGAVAGVSPGIYRYHPGNHVLVRLVGGDKRKALWTTALLQFSVRHGAVALVFTAVYERTIAKYGQRGERYVHMEAGHAAQNVYLQATALGIGTVAVGAFHDGGVKKVLHLPEGERPLCIMPLGRI